MPQCDQSRTPSVVRLTEVPAVGVRVTFITPCAIVADAMVSSNPAEARTG